MKYSRTLLFALLVAFLPALAFAGAKDSGKQSKDITFSQAVQVGNQQLKPGEYKVSWNTTGDSANVTFSQYGKEKASVPARFVQGANQSNISIETNTATATPTLKKVYVKNGALEFNGDATAAAPTTGQ